MKIGELVQQPKTNFKPVLKELQRIGLVDDRDVDSLYHLYIPAAEEIALEGIIGATVKDAFGQYGSAYSEVKGWFLGVESKRKYVEDICEDLIDWLKDKDIDNPSLDLDMGSFKTWMKTSETFFWRYYFLLNDSMWNEAKAAIKKGEITNIEVLTDFNWKDRTQVTRMLDSIPDIAGLIKIVELYKKRSNEYFETIIKRKTKIKNAPFQVILLGATDLRLTVKKIVNLAT